MMLAKMDTTMLVEEQAVIYWCINGLIADNRPFLKCLEIGASAIILKRMR